jgi:hypothetical protein
MGFCGMIEQFQDAQGMVLISYRVAEGLLCVSIDEEGEHSWAFMHLATAVPSVCVEEFGSNAANGASCQ